MKKVLTIAIVFALAFGFAVGCGGEVEEDKPAFANVHSGEYFEISYPDGWEVKDEGMAGFTISPISEDDEEDDGFNMDMTAITIQDIKADDSKRGDLQKAIEEIEAEQNAEGMEGMEDMFDFEETTFAGEKALKMSITFLVTMESYIIPMDGWTITVGMIGSDKTAKKILDTFKITDPNYSGSEDLMDFDMGDDTDDDWDTEFPDDEDDEMEDLFGSEEDLAVGETYEGEYFTITKPDNFTFDVYEEAPYSVTFSCPEFTLMIECEEEEGYIWSDTEALKDEVEEEINSGEISVVEDIELGFNSAVWLEGEGEMGGMIMVGVPMTDWLITIMAMGYEDTDEMRAEIRKMIMTFDVTDMFYLPQ
jgi:hypothetical protein